ncbi:MAG: hypothetical protein COW85_14520 [Ignavibacteria bacterium CG22_combo_CG10-13_8_21_14_all_37_15]|nr:MAG: hypothetical protein COW85_14520 [Ignavibacteria bacterium CG22_combo_CG10-13_8_21_14_all_37_15]
MIDNKDKDNILQLIENNPIEREYFFRKLAKVENPFEWFYDLKNLGYLNPSKNPIETKDQKGNYTIPYWEVLDFLLNVAEQNSNKPMENVTKELVMFIDSVIDYNNSIDRIDNYRTDWILLKIISLLPFEYIKERYIQYISSALNTSWDNTLIVEVIEEKIIPYLLKNYPNSNSLLVLLMDAVWQYKKPAISKSVDEFTSIMAEYWLEEMMGKWRKPIVEKMKEDGVKIAEKKMREIINEDKSQFNLIWIPHIKDDQQNKFTDRYEIQLTFFIRDCLIESNLEFLRKNIKNYLKEEHPIFRRLAIHSIDKRYIDLHDIFWGIKDNPLEYPTIKHELYTFFQNHSEEFTSEEINKIISWIENKNFGYLNLDEFTKKNKDAIICYKKKEWLSSLLNSKIAEIRILYKKYDDLNPRPLDHPGLDYWMGDFTFGDKEVETPKDLCEKRNEEIAEYFKNKVVDNTRLNYSVMDDYAESLKECIQKKPEKYLENMIPFQSLSHLYKYEILRAFLELWRNGKEYEWENLLKFIDETSNNLDYEYKYEENDFAYRDWIIGVIADLIEEGTKSDGHSFNADLLPIAKKILLHLENKTISKTHFTIDLATSILNSTRGKIYTAIVNYALRYARLYKKDEFKRFDPDILQLFNNRLLEKQDEEFFYSLGKFISNLLFLDKDWVFENINQIFNKEIENLWIYAMSGYLFYGTRVNKDIYFKLKEENHLLKAINTEFADRHLNSRIIQFFCISFLNKWEDLNTDDSLMKIVIEKAQPHQLKEIIHFIWAQRKFIDEKSLQGDILILLTKLYVPIMTISDDKVKNELLSDLARWIVYVNFFTSETQKIFLEISKHSSDHFNTMQLVEGLNKIVHNSPNEVAEILFTVIDQDEKHPYYKQDVLTNIFDELKKNKLEDWILKICNLFLKKGLYNYKEVLTKYLPQKDK